VFGEAFSEERRGARRPRRGRLQPQFALTPPDRSGWGPSCLPCIPWCAVAVPTRVRMTYLLSRTRWFGLAIPWSKSSASIRTPAGLRDHA